VFFSGDYAAEFTDVFERRHPPTEPTVYVCAQDRPARDGTPPDGEERLFCLINAPPDGDRHAPDPGEIDAWQRRMTRRLERCGLELIIDPGATLATTPSDFAARFPATGGALYGRASHGWRASFLRPGSRTALPGLYLAGGSTHPGPGLPMATLSGRLAAASLCRDLDSIARSRRTAMPGGISTRPATTGAKPSR
jgi:1-hydroxycarotenoid 3,4-desaturase